MEARAIMTEPGCSAAALRTTSTASRKTNGKALTPKTCAQIADLVLNYLNAGLSPRVKREFDQHLRICPDCVAFLNTYRKTIAVTKAVRVQDMPEEVRRNILNFLQGRGKRTGA